MELAAPLLIEAVPAQLEQVLNFELAVVPGVRHRCSQVGSPIWVGGAQTSFQGHMGLHPGVESFAIFFHPMGWSHLLPIPMSEITNRIYDATSVHRVLAGLCHQASRTAQYSSQLNRL